MNKDYLIIIAFLVGLYFGHITTQYHYINKIKKTEEKYEEQIKTLKSIRNNFDYNDNFKLLRTQMHKNSIATKGIDGKTQRIKELALQVASLQDYLIQLNESCK